MNRYTCCAVSLLLYMIGSTNALANDLDQLVRDAVNNNLGLLATQHQNAADIQLIQSENNLSDPEIMLQHEWGNKAAEGNKWNVTVTQTFDWPSLYRARSNYAKSMNRVATYDLDALRLQKMLDIKIVLLQIIKCKNDMAGYEEVAKHINGIVAMQSAALKSNDITVVDFAKIKLESIATQRQLDECRIELESASMQLNSLCGGNDVLTDRLIAAVNDFPFECLLAESEYETLIVHKSPELLANSMRAKAMNDQLSVVHRSQMPSFTLGYMYENEQIGAYNGIVAGMTLPFFSKRHKSKATKLQIQAIHENNNDLRLQMCAEMRAERRNALSLLNTVESYRSVLDMHDFNELLKSSLFAGKINVTDYLRELDFFITAKQDYNKARYDLCCSLARLNRLNLLD